MNETSPSGPRPTAYLLSGVVGGLIAVVLGAILVATDVIDTGDTTTRVVREGIPARPVSTDAGGGRTVSEIYKEEGRGVVYIEARGRQSESQSPFGLPDQGGTATGSGFVVDEDGTIITNAHVVEGSSDVSVRFEDEGDLVDAEVVGRDTSTDVAVLKVDPDEAKLQPLPLGDSKSAQVGDPAIAIGNPFGYTRTVTTGIVSALQRRIEAPNGFTIPNVIQTDAAINPGNSGGPLLDANGRVIGINSQIATGGSQGSIGIGFAVPINTVKELLPELKEDGEVERAFLGVTMVTVTDQLASDLNLPAKEGALVTSVTDGGPADKAALRGGRTQIGENVTAGGDLIVKVDGKDVSGSDDVSAAVESKKPGDEIEIEYYRGDDKKTAKVKLTKRPDSLNQPSSSQGGGGDLFPQIP